MIGGKRKREKNSHSHTRAILSTHVYPLSHSFIHILDPLCIQYDIHEEKEKNAHTKKPFQLLKITIRKIWLQGIDDKWLVKF